MKNPLYKRLPRELRSELGKYLVLFLFIALMIGVTSGYMVGNNSLYTSYKANFNKMKIENGHFILGAEAGGSVLSTIKDLKDVDLAKSSSAISSDTMLDTLFEALIGDADGDVLERIEKEEDVQIEAQFYKDKTATAGKIKDDNFRIYTNRKNINQVECMKGNFPKKDNEISIDRLYATNNNIDIGDKITVAGKKYTVCGYTALSDYTALYRKNTDTMFDANHFTVALVTDSAWEKMGDGGLKYNYAWRNNDQSLSDKEQQDKAENIGKILASEGTVKDLVARPDNNAINFAGDDVSKDVIIMQWMLYVIIVVIAFIFGITTRSTIENEARTIGTLKASGYSNRELMGHYLALPMAVTFAAAIVGNIIGYTWMKTAIINVYCSNYSFGSYTTVWNAKAFVLTTLVPLAIIFAVNVLVIGHALRYEPLQFLRRELHRKKKNRKALKLPMKNFKTRFRMRIIIQNKGAYTVLFIGIFLASVLMLFGMSMGPMVDSFKDDILDSQFANYQYVLKAQYYVEDESAEKYGYTSLQNTNGEDIAIYGIKENSKYFKGNLVKATGTEKEIPVLVSSSYMDKYQLKEGAKITLKDKYEGSKYTFTLKRTHKYPSTLCIFMPLTAYNKMLGNSDGYYTGYFSNHKLTELNDIYIATTITQKDLTLTADQLSSSMGGIFGIMKGFTIVLYILVLYLLAKISIDRNGHPISLIKILGYTNNEIGSLYSRATGIVSIVSLIICTGLAWFVFRWVFYAMMQTYTGWITYYVPPKCFVEIIAIGVICYLVVSRILLRRIHRIPMTDALKGNE
jgi:putative ABC transport system permease protein